MGFELQLKPHFLSLLPTNVFFFTMFSFPLHATFLSPFHDVPLLFALLFSYSHCCYPFLFVLPLLCSSYYSPFLFLLLISYFRYKVFHTSIAPKLLFIERSCTPPLHSFLQELEVIESQ